MGGIHPDVALHLTVINVKGRGRRVGDGLEESFVVGALEK
jgi:hypothetical protein